MSVPWPDSSTQMSYLGNSYSCLFSQQRCQSYEELLKRCHSLDVLRQERVVLPNEALPAGIPTNPGIGIRHYVMSPRHRDSAQKRKAVVVACEFGIAESRRNEPVAICAVDCLTGDTLVSSLVAPSQPMFDWRKNIHGIDLHHMTAAMKSGQCLAGWRAARDKLFEHIDEETILVGYGIRLPLELLRFYHTNIVDAQVLVTAAVLPRRVPLMGKGKYKSPLPHVCSEFLRITLRQGLHGEVGIHERLENALAAREIALKCIQKPNELRDWAHRKEIEFWTANPTAKGVHHYTSTSNQTSAGPLSSQNSPNQNVPRQNVPEQIVPNVPKKTVHEQSVPKATSALDTPNDEYEAWYRAGFESGFRMGYERGLENTNERQKQTSTEKNQLEESHSECQPQKLISFSDDESEPGDRNGISDCHENGETSAAEVGGLLARLMKDDKIRDIIQSGKLDWDEKVTNGK